MPTVPARRQRPAVLACLAAPILLALAIPASASTTFTDVTAAAGISYIQHVPPAPPACPYSATGVCEPERMSGGAAVADVDGDGDLDLFVTRLDAPDLLYINQGNGTFVDGSVAAGLAAFDLQSNGAAFGDIDEDGDADLLVTVHGAAGDPLNRRNFLFINDGSGVFSEEAVARGADAATSLARLTWSATFGDYDRDGYLDLHVTEWIDSGGHHSRLLRNQGATAPGHFVDVTTAAGLDFALVNGFASTFVDLDGDGWQDLAVAADFGTSRLFWNQGNGTFLNGTVAAGVGTDENGMGSAFGDIDGDGDLDWFVTSIHDPAETCETENCSWGYTGNRLYRNDGGRLFTDITDLAGVRAGYWGWGAAFFDADNDGDLDLVMTNGVDFPIATVDDAFNSDPMRFWENDGSGVMTEVSVAAGLTDTGSGKGLLSFDYDGDGDLDLFLVNNAAGPRLYRNDLGAGADWIRVEARGTLSNRDARGARIKVWADLALPPQVHEVGVGAHFLAEQRAPEHFGLGPGVSVVPKIEVYYPRSGRVRTRTNVTSGTTLVISEKVSYCGLLGIEALLPLFAAVVFGAFTRRSGRG